MENHIEHVHHEHVRISRDTAVLCLDCDHLYDTRRPRCHCGSRSALPVSRIIGPVRRDSRQ